MTQWNHDMSAAPRDGSEVILAMPNKTSLRSHWRTPKGEPAHWCMLSHKNQPVAWMPWPEHPSESPRKAAEAVSERTATQVDLQGGSAEATREGQPSMTVATSAESASNDGLPVETAGETAPLFILDDVGSGA